MAKKVMIDPGHGPADSANRGPTGYVEYVGMWKLSNFLKQELEKQGIQADLTRKENETPSLSARGTKAAGCDLFISEHSNAFDGTVRGVECYYSLKRQDDMKWAALLALEVARVMGNNSRGAKTKESTTQKGLDYYGVIRAAAATNCPHIFLIENGFHDNPIDEAFLKQETNLKKIAETQAKVICQILNVPYQEQTSADQVEVYVVQPGDTLSHIAQRYGTTWQALAQYNNLANPSLIRVGQQIRIPAKNDTQDKEEIKQLKKQIDTLNEEIKELNLQNTLLKDKLKKIKELASI